MKTQKEVKPQHTPLPWKALRRELTFGDKMYCIGEFYETPLQGNPEANALFVERAVNAHEQLLEVVKLVRRLALVKGQTELGRRCDEAIAKTEGK